MRAIEAAKTVEIPEGVDVSVDGRTVTVKGAKGALTRSFSGAPISIVREDKAVKVWASWPRKKETAIVGTVSSHIKNMITGVTKGYTYKLKIVFSHFPISVEVKDKTISIKNFTGERSPRFVQITGDVKVTVKEDDISVQGLSLEDVSQTAGNIEQGTKVKVKDPRVFLDGIYIYEKREGMEGA